MTTKNLIDRGFKPFADYDGKVPITDYYFSTMGTDGKLAPSGGYLGIYFHRNNLVIRWSLNYVYPEGAHNPPCLETIYNKKHRYYIETAYNMALKMSGLEDCVQKGVCRFSSDWDNVNKKWI